MPAKKKRPRKKKVELVIPEQTVPVTVIDPPKVSRIESARRGLWRLILFLAGLSPLALVAFQILVLRLDIHLSTAHVILILIGLLISFIIANIADDKISQSAKDISPTVRGFLSSSMRRFTSEQEARRDYDH